jgi:hypothetical protein
MQMNWYLGAAEGQEVAMPTNQTPTPSAEEIQVRSYLLWEREGCQDGKSEEYWLRAKAELEAEMEATWHAASIEASMEGENTTFVLPVLPISTPPSRSVSEKIPERPELKKAAG